MPVAAAGVGSVKTLADQPFEPYATGGPEQVGADLALLERRDKDAVRAAGQEPRQICFAQAEMLEGAGAAAGGAGPSPSRIG